MTTREIFKRRFENGWYIEESINETRHHKRQTKLWQMVRDEPDGTKSLWYYFAYDVAKAMVKECGATIKKASRTNCWLNDNPERWSPQKGHKIEEVYEHTVENVLA